MIRYKLIILVFISIINNVVSYSQKVNKCKEVKFFEKKLSNSLSHEVDFLINNGKIYIVEIPRAKGNPYFKNKACNNGQIILNKKSYKDRQLLYDIYKDRVICMSDKINKKSYPIIIPNNFIDSFSLHNTRFINIVKNKGLLEKGFYQVFYSGDRICCLVKWKKKYLEDFSKNYLGEYRLVKKRIFIERNEQYYQIKNEDELISIFKDKKEYIENYIEDKKFNFRKANESELLSLLKYCDSLI